MHSKMLFFAVFEQRAAARVVFRPGVDIGVEPERGGLDALSAQRIYAVDRAGGAAGVQKQFIHEKRPAFLYRFRQHSTDAQQSPW